MTDKERQVKMRLGWFRHVEEITGNVAKTCRYFGISRKTYYKWYNRYLKEGEKGLVERSRRPNHISKETKHQVIEKILYLRTNYHFGPTRIKMYLERYHGIIINSATIWKMLKRLNMNRLPTNQIYKPHN
ncbi:MAG: helix-turn-helix domain-containing protein [Candidatus Omnitrophica bacterium]|nr:helix-turn-helix domain-containing protein [Candidatus Omnitrophota bacterium]